MQFSEQDFANRFDVSRETIERLHLYAALLEKWNSKINLVSKSTIPDIWHRHFADSAQLWNLIPETSKKWLDFGAGAGFPGLLNAVLAKEKQPSLKFSLVESDQRKCAFLASVSRELELNAIVVPERIEKLEPQGADIITARAVASLDKLLEMAAPHGRKSTVFLFPKGNNYESELTAARNHWHIELSVIQSLTEAGSVILKIEDIERAK